MTDPTAYEAARLLLREVRARLVVDADVEWILSDHTPVAPRSVELCWDDFRHLALAALASLAPTEQPVVDPTGDTAQDLLRYSRRMFQWQTLITQRITDLEEKLRELQVPAVRTKATPAFHAAVAKGLAQADDLAGDPGADRAAGGGSAGVERSASFDAALDYAQSVADSIGRGTFRDPADAQMDLDIRTSIPIALLCPQGDRDAGYPHVWYLGVLAQGEADWVWSPGVGSHQRCARCGAVRVRR